MVSLFLHRISVVHVYSSIVATTQDSAGQDPHHFGDWLIPLNLMSSRFIHVVAVSECPVFLRLNNITVYAIPHFLNPITWQWVSGFFPPFGYYE